jgi:hypothetical protein
VAEGEAMNQYVITTRVWPIISQMVSGSRATLLFTGILILTGIINPQSGVVYGQSAQGRQFHVSPAGAPENDGSAQRPLDLATALSQSSPARPGDVIWLHDGTYRGSFVSHLTGTAAAPIIVRQHPGERATIDSGTSASDALTVRGGYTWFWGFEITSSDSKRISAESGPSPRDLRRGYGATTDAPGIKFINLIVHDNANGLGLWSESVGSEAYGNIVYYNGWQGPDRAYGHGINTQNATGRRLVADNVLFHQFSHGIHAYGSSAASLDNITLDGNISFMNGSISRGGIHESGRELLLGGHRPAANLVVSANATYGGQTNIGFSAGCVNGRVTNNYFAGALLLIKCNPVMTGNTLWNSPSAEYGTLPADYPQNTFHSSLPAGTSIRIRPNKYEPGRAHIVIYNWGTASVVPVDISAAKLPRGAAFEIRDAQDYFGAPVATGTYDERPVNLVMAGLRAGAAVGNVPVAPLHTAPQFAVFVVVPVTASTSREETADLSAAVTSSIAGQSTALAGASSSNASVASIDQVVGNALTSAVTVNLPFTLAWNPNQEPNITGYRVSYGTTSGQYTTSINVGNTTSHTVTSLGQGSTYYFAVQALNSAGVSPYSSEVAATVGSPLTVTSLTPNTTSPQPVGTTITFSATASGGSAPYQYKWWIVNGTALTVGSNWSTNSSFAWTPTSANANYTIRVWARNFGSTADAADNPSAIREVSFAITAPGGSTNQAPIVNAGADQNITLPSAATMSATVSDDGLPSGVLTRNWTRVSGPGTVTFSASTSAVTSASFSMAGAYVLRLTVSDGALSTSDDVAVTVAPAATTTGGLVSHWRLDESSGVTATDTAGPRPGTLADGAKWSTGKKGGGVLLDGVDDYIALPDFDVPGSALTIAAWVKSSSFPTSSDQRFISKATSTAEQDHYWMLGQTISGQSRLRFRLKTNGTTTTLIASSGDLPLDTWYHATATYDGANMRLYLNGVEVGSTTKSGAMTSGADVPVEIGRNPDGSNFMHGVIDDVRIYNRALTPAEVSNIVADTGSSPNQAPVVSAGPDRTVTWPGNATLSGTVTDDGQPTAAIQLNWTRVSGPGAVTFSPSNAATTTASFSAAGTYVLGLTASDGELSASDQLMVTVATTTNKAPTVNSGADRSIILTGSTALTATVSDDGLPSPPGTLTLSWTRVSGTGSVTFSAPNAATTNASFSIAGVYVIRLTASDGALNTSDDVTVTVLPVPPLVPSLVAHYRLDDGDGNTAKDDTGAYSGRLVNGAAWVAGRYAGGVSFDGVNDHIVLPNINTSGSGFTISTWVRTSSLPPTIDQRFVSKATGTAEQAHDWMLGLTANRLRFRLKTNGVTTTLIASSGNLPLNTWYHATATYDGSYMRLYLNGVRVGIVAKTGAVATGSVPVNLGRNPDGSNYMHGALDDVRIYNRALTPSEIVVLMRTP